MSLIGKHLLTIGSHGIEMTDKSQTDILSQIRGCHYNTCDLIREISVTKYRYLFSNPFTHHS